MDFQLVCDGLSFPEGPVAFDDGTVIVTEIRAGRLTRVSPDGQKETVAETGGGPNGAAMGPDGALYVANNGGRFRFRDQGGLTFSGSAPPEHTGGSIQRVELATGRVETVYEAAGENRLWAPNDLVFDRSGGFWFTDHGRSDGATLNYGGLYYARPDGSHVTKARGQMISPNGVGLSPDESVAYVADTHLGRLWCFALASPGVLGQQPPGQPAGVLVNLPGYQLLDSLAVEADGRICVATLINGGVTTVSLDGITEHVPLPDPMITNLCFGGPDMRDVWITASATGRLYRGRWPRPGLRLNFQR